MRLRPRRTRLERPTAESPGRCSGRDRPPHLARSRSNPGSLRPGRSLDRPRLGVFRLINQFSPDILPGQTRDEERAVTSTASLNRIQRDEFAKLPMTLKEAAALTTIGDRPLIIVTAAKGAQAGWLPLQDKMASLSTNSVHRVLPDTDHPGLIDDRIGAAQASHAILDVLASVRSGTPLS